MKSNTICVHMLDYLLRYAAAQGLDRELICARAGLETSRVGNPDARIKASVFVKVWQDISLETSG